MQAASPFRVLYRGSLTRLVDLEILSAAADVQKLLVQFAAMLAAASFARHAERLRCAEEKVRCPGHADSGPRARSKDLLADAAGNRALRYDVGEACSKSGWCVSSLLFISKKTLLPVLGLIAGIAGSAIAIAGLMM